MSRKGKAGRLLTYILRHNPGRHGVTVDDHGWADINDVVRGMRAVDLPVYPETITRIVAESDGKRFEIDGGRIRALHGHSIPVELTGKPSRPPTLLYHGTASYSVYSIQGGGIHRQGRQHVHLSSTAANAEKVGARHGDPVVLTVRARDMADEGHEFWRSSSGVWLTRHVPPRFLGA